MDRKEDNVSMDEAKKIERVRWASNVERWEAVEEEVLQRPLLPDGEIDVRSQEEADACERMRIERVAKMARMVQARPCLPDGRMDVRSEEEEEAVVEYREAMSEWILGQVRERLARRDAAKAGMN